MDIKINIKEKNDIPTEHIFHGNSALEQMFDKIIEKYYGEKIAKEVRYVLNKRITEKEINDILNHEITKEDVNRLLNTDINKILQKRIL